jgi:hypothetical protein
MKGEISMERVEIFTKETLLCYLINELSDGNYEITTHLTDDGCWLGSIDIRKTTLQNWTDTDDQEYYHELSKHLLKVEKLHKQLG